MADETNEWLGLARAHLAPYAEYVHGYVPPDHAMVWLRELGQALASDDLVVLVCDAPPGHAKSSYFSEVLPTWYLGRFPDRAVLHLTSTDNLAGLYHAVVDATLKGDPDDPRGARHRAVFPEERCRQGDVWNFEKGLKLKGAREKVSYKMAGFGSAILGLRADLIVLDDPLTEEKATSQTELEKAKRYFDRTVWTRKKPGAKVVLIATRWGYADLTAHVVEKYGKVVRLIHMPALGYWDGLATKGGALWPGYIPRESLLEEAERMETTDFLCIFQGEPGNPEGMGLNPDLVQPLPRRLPIVSTVQFWDLAFTDNRKSDWSVCATLGSDGGGNLFLLDVFRARLTQHQFELALEQRYALYGPSVIGIEKVSAVEWVVQALENSSLLPVRGVPVGPASKEQRANLFATKVQQRRFYADREAEWWLPLAQEMRQFPRGKHDDMVDAISGACHLLLGRQIALVRSQKLLHLGQTPDEVRRKQWRARRMAAQQSALQSQRTRLVRPQ